MGQPVNHSLAFKTPIRVAKQRYSQVEDTASIKVLLAHSTRMECQLMQGALNQSRYPFEILAGVASRSEALECLRKQPPDIVVLSEDVGDGPYSGFGLLHEIHAAHPSLRMILLLRTATPERVVDAFRSGARGVISGDSSCEYLCKSIYAVHKGQIWANSQELQYLIDALEKATSPNLTLSTQNELLSQREREVAGLVTEGMTNHEIAENLHLSDHTVSNYLFRIYEKLGLSSRVELVLYVVRQSQMGY